MISHAATYASAGKPTGILCDPIVNSKATLSPQVAPTGRRRSENRQAAYDPKRPWRGKQDVQAQHPSPSKDRTDKVPLTGAGYASRRSLHCVALPKESPHSASFSVEINRVACAVLKSHSCDAA